jgi:hypothetical protein
MQNSNYNIINTELNLNSKSIFVYLCDTTSRYVVWRLIIEYPYKQTLEGTTTIGVDLCRVFEKEYKEYSFKVQDIILKPYPPPFLAVNRSCGSYYRINIAKYHKSKPLPPYKLPPIKPSKHNMEPLLKLLDNHKRKCFPIIGKIKKIENTN